MNNDKYYIGFEGYPSIILFDSTKDNSMEIWIGYFETIMDGMLDQGIMADGILNEYIIVEGWYSNELWEVKDIMTMLDQFLLFDINAITSDVSQEIIKVLPEIKEEIIEFLNRVKNGKVYISYC